MRPNHHEDTIYRLALTFIKDIGPRRAKGLLAHFGDAKSVFDASVKDLKHADGLGDLLAKQTKSEMQPALELAAKELEFIARYNISVLWVENEDYPQRLKNCSDAPILLYYKGKANINAGKTVAVIGTRKYTDYGQRLCDELTEGLKDLEDVIVVSGLAHGIDTIAHKNALKDSLPTIGVLGHGLDRIYPASNKTLAKDMIEAGGGLLSEFPSGTNPDKSNFPMRNRIVAGISDVTVVVESDITGGALITARIASSYNRDVAAYPGRVHDSKSSGCNELIRTNIAAMISRAEDLKELMGWQTTGKPKAVQKQLFLNLSPEEDIVVKILQTKDFVHSDELLHVSGLANSQLAATLLGLEMQGLVKALPGKLYRMN